MAGAGRVIDACELPGLIAGKREGLARYSVDVDAAAAELVTLVRSVGVG